jgi:hypothetical protein
MPGPWLEWKIKAARAGLPPGAAALFACDCAERVLLLIAARLPGDKRASRVLAFARRKASGAWTELRWQRDRLAGALEGGR